MKLSCRNLLLTAGSIGLLPFASALAASPSTNHTSANYTSAEQIDSTIPLVTQAESSGITNGNQVLTQRGLPCVSCPVDATVLENEPTLSGPTDDLNSTCLTATTIALGDIVCGKSNGFVVDKDTIGRDIDFYTFELTQSTVVDIEVRGALPIISQLLSNGDCSAAFGVVASDTDGTECDPIVFSELLAPGFYTLFVTSLNFGPDLVPEFDYFFSIQGTVPAGVCCDFDGICSDVADPDACDFFFTADTTCAEVTCVQIVCPTEGKLEAGGAEILSDGYIDGINSGCNLGGGSFAVVDTAVCGDVWCGTSGNYISSTGAPTRDTDWYLFELFQTTEVNWRVTASFDAQSIIIQTGPSGDECSLGFTQVATGAPGVAFDNVATLGPGTYFLFVSPQEFTGTPANAPYIAEVFCSAPTTEACCFNNGNCMDMLAPDCFAAGGVAQGAGTACTTSPCCVVCDGTEVAEGEVDCFDSRVDDFNAGCNFATAFNTTPLSTNSTLCGTTGTFATAGGGATRDTDWYSYNHPGGPFTVTVETAGFVGLAGFLNVAADGSNCSSAAFLPGLAAFVDGCTPVTFEAEAEAGTFIFFVSTAEFTGVPCSFDYSIEVALTPTCDPTCADATGEGDVNLDDLDAVLINFGSSVPTGEDGDVNCDGVVDLDDLDLVLINFGSSC